MIHLLNQNEKVNVLQSARNIFGHWTSIQRNNVFRIITAKNILCTVLHINQTGSNVYKGGEGTHSVPSADAKSSREVARIQLDKKCSYLQQVEALGRTHTILRALTVSRCLSYTAGFGSKLLEAVEQRSSIKHSITPLAFPQKLQS